MMKRLGKTNIEYGDRSWNFFVGCLHKPAGICVVPNCWAEGMSKRQKQDFHKPHLVPELLLAPLRVKKPSTILVNFMGDLMGDWVDPEQQVFIKDGWNSLRQIVFMVIRARPEHRFLFLTKAPWNYKLWGDFPDNAWLGASVWNEETMVKALYALTEVKAGGRWLSVEPMLAPVVPNVWPAEWDEIGWVVIGPQSTPRKLPEFSWVEELVNACNRNHVPVFLKKELNCCEIADYPVLLDKNGNLRQEFPKR